MLNWNNIFWLSVKGKRLYPKNSDKIEFTGCSRAENSCLDYLPSINNYFRESDRFCKKRDFIRSTEALEKAYHKALELQEPGCLNCALFFQATVLHSLETLHNDLEKKTKSVFANRRIRESFIKTDELLNRIKTGTTLRVSYPIKGESTYLQPVYQKRESAIPILASVS